MKTVTVRELQKKIGECVDAAQRAQIVVTRHGRPAAILVGVEGKDWETIYWEHHAELWKTLEKRRGEPTISLNAIRQRLGLGKTAGFKKVKRVRVRGR